MCNLLKNLPLQIPDTITLDTSDPSVLGGGRGVSGNTESGERDFPSEAKGTEDNRQLQPKAEGEKLLPHM